MRLNMPLFILTLGLVISVPTSAAELYFNAGISSTDASLETTDLNNVVVDEQGSGLKLGVVWRLRDYFEVEGFWANFGEQTVTANASNASYARNGTSLGPLSIGEVDRYRGKFIGAGAIGRYAINESFDVYAKTGFGLYALNTNRHQSEDDGTDGYVGLGARAMLNERLGAGLEFNAYSLGEVEVNASTFFLIVDLD